MPKKSKSLLQPLVSRNLKRLRTQRGLQQAKLAELATAIAAKYSEPFTVVQATISQIEIGDIREPGISTIRALAEALQTPVNAFWADPDNPDTMDSGMRAFLDSQFAEGITEDETLLLSQIHMPVEGMPLQSWYHVLQAIRIALQARAKRP